MVRAEQVLRALNVDEKDLLREYYGGRFKCLEPVRRTTDAEFLFFWAWKMIYPEAATGGILQKKVFLEVSRNSQENTCPESLFNKVNNNKGLRPATLLKKRLCHRCFPVNFAKFLRTPFLQNTSGRLLLYIHKFWIRHLHSTFKFDHENICGIEIRHHFSW